MRTRALCLTAFACAALAGCALENGSARPLVQATGALPAPVSNNAVAVALDGERRSTLYSFMGIGPGKTHADIVVSAFACVEADLKCREIPDVPVSQGRLASVAASVRGKIYLFGGYTVAPDGAEKSTPEVFEFDPATQAYRRMADIPTPVDDTTAIALFDRYIYLVSGWHDDSNIPLVQVYDANENQWFRATDFPGSPVFGHAGGGEEKRLMIAGGVKLTVAADGKRIFDRSNEVWVGEIADRAKPAVIDWSPAPAPPVGPFYRMAASQGGNGRILFAGGGDNPYNYDGVGYDGRPSSANMRLLAYDTQSARWSTLGDLPASMDHRGMVRGERGLYILGGMDGARAVTDRVIRVDLTALKDRGRIEAER